MVLAGAFLAAAVVLFVWGGWFGVILGILAVLTALGVISRGYRVRSANGARVVS